MNDAAFIFEAARPFSARHNCLSAAAVALAGYPKADDAFAKWLGRPDRKRMTDIAGHRTAAVAEFAFGEKPVGVGEAGRVAFGVAELKGVQICAVKSGGAWYCRATPIGVVKVDPENIVAVWNVE